MGRLVHQAPFRHPAHGFEDVLQRVRRVRVVDEYGVVPVRGHYLHPALDAPGAGERIRALGELYAQAQPRTDYAEGVVDGEEAGDAQLHTLALAVIGSRKGHAGAREGDVVRREVAALALGEGYRRAWAVLQHEFRPLVVEVYDGAVAHGEQQALRARVFVHGLVEVQVVLGEVGEDAHGKVQARHAVQHQRVAAHLHDHVRAAGVGHLAQELLQLAALGRGALGVEELRTYHVAVRTYEADGRAALLLEQVL